MVFATAFLVLAGFAVRWAARDRHLVGAGLGLVLLGLCVAMSYEAAAIWVHHRWLPTISRITNDAFHARRTLSGVIFFFVIFLAGLLTIRFTRLADNHGSGPDWSLLGTAVLIMLNGALLAFWFNWLP
jgi:hypothetical protein